MEQREIKKIIQRMPVEEIIENLVYLIAEMDDKEQEVFLGIAGITEEQFMDYESVRESAVTNMMDVKKVCSISGLTREQVIEIMENYSSYEKKYIRDDTDGEKNNDN